MTIRTTIALTAAALLVAACGSNYEAPPASEGGNTQQQSTAPAANTGVPPGTGPILETMNSGGYTYAKVDLGGQPVWAAGPQVPVKVGDTVKVSDGQPMNSFHSKTLDRTFDVIWFVSSIEPEGGAKIEKDLGGGMRTQPTPPAEIAAGSIPRVEGGQTVEEIITGAADLSGKQIAVRGKVVKFNAEIMGANWLHIQDGSGAAGTNDLTVTTDATVDVGDMVVVRGTVTTDKDFGAGYKYAVIVENAEVTKE
jgi:hypothetical protein